jgi:peptidoglycan/xylan/chitin deacetylase (PgdA/CDA1 family)
VIAPDDHAAPWSRRRILRVLAPMPLLALDGCGNGTRTGASSAGAPQAGPDGPPSPGEAPEETTDTSGAYALSAEPEVSQAPSITDAVALTFHGDGPPQLAEALLAEAEKAGARLTVLAVGRWLAQYPQMAERVLKGGHELGNHTENHLAVDRMSASQAFNEIEQCAQRLQQLTGSRGRWFRQSQGQHASPTVRAAATRAGYGTLLSYDLDSRDFLNPGSTSIVHTVLGRIRGGDVVSLHLGHPQTVQALPQILTALQTRGLRAVTASEIFPPGVDTGSPPLSPSSTASSSASTSAPATPTSSTPPPRPTSQLS